MFLSQRVYLIFIADSDKYLNCLQQKKEWENDDISLLIKDI